MTIVFALIFLVGCALLYFAGEWVIIGLTRIAKFLGWREFVVAFFIMAIAASRPNLFIGVTSALRGIPELSFGDIAGNNIIAMTLAVSLALFFARGGIPAKCKTVRATSVFTMAAAVFPLILILDKELSRLDGLLLILFFFCYMIWLFSKKERFSRIYTNSKLSPLKDIRLFLSGIFRLSLGIVALLLAAQGIVFSAQFFAHELNISLVIIGVLITGAGSALPEVYFAIISAKKNKTGLILGNLMGAVIIPATLILGIVAIIHPIDASDFSPFAIARVFLVISSLFFLIFVRSDRRLSKKEGVILFAVYAAFVIAEISRMIKISG